MHTSPAVAPSTEPKRPAGQPVPGKRWHPKLDEKCKRDCSSVKMWDAHVASYKKRHGALLMASAPKPALADIAPKDSKICARGCDRYWACMIQATYPAKRKYPYKISPVRRMVT